MIKILQEAAYKGGEVLRSYFKKKYKTSLKTSHQNIVTEADIKSQKIIKKYLEEEIPKKLVITKEEIGFIGEEKLVKKGKVTFIIDPLDGTSNFATGFEYFSIIIGVMIDNMLTHGLIYSPMQDLMYYAEKGKGTFRKDDSGIKQIRIKKTDLKNIYFSGGFSVYDDLRKLQMDMYHKLFPHFRSYLSLNAGGSSIGEFLDGVFGVYFMGGPKIWDIAGAKILVEEAGGVMVNWYGKPFELDLEDYEKTYPMFVCHPGNLAEILEFMK